MFINKKIRGFRFYSFARYCRGILSKLSGLQTLMFGDFLLPESIFTTFSLSCRLIAQDIDRLIHPAIVPVVNTDTAGTIRQLLVREGRQYRSPQQTSEHTTLTF